MTFMNRRQLDAAMADRLGDGELAERTVTAFLEAITAAVARGERVDLDGFGTFARARRPAQAYRNRMTGERGEVPATYVPRFVAGDGFRAAVAARAR
jgi:DNA-binding protein HU-beta